MNKSVQQSRPARPNENIWGHFKNNTVPITSGRHAEWSAVGLEGWRVPRGEKGATPTPGRRPGQKSAAMRANKRPRRDFGGKNRRNHSEVGIL